MFWSLIYIVWNELYLKEGTNILIIFFIPVKAHLWFLYAIIGIYIVLPFIQILIKNMNKRLESLFIWLWIIFAGAIYIYRITLSLFGIDTSIDYPVSLIQDTYYLGYFMAGYIIYKRLLNLRNIKQYKKITVIIFIISTLITFTGTLILSIIQDSYYENLFGYRSLFIIISSISVYCLFIMHKDTIGKKVNIKIIKNLSTYSLGVYLAHPIYLDLFSRIIIKIPSYIGIPIFLIIIFYLSYTTTWLLSRIKYLRELI
jgi:surface polysaccharide O-acyltransferase-like enzyme